MSSTFLPFKVFCIGLPKCGTSSLGTALTHLGYNVINGIGQNDFSLTKEELLFKCDEAVSSYNAFQDDPWCFQYSRYKDKYPDAKFILSTRPLARWLNSMDIFGDRDIPIWRFGFGKTKYRGNERYFRDFFIQHNQDVVNSFRGEPGRLLVLNIEGDAVFNMLSIQAFLGLGVNDTSSLPHSNLGRKNKIRWLFKRRKWERLASE